MSKNTSEKIKFVTSAARPLTGELRVPGDKSMSHRSVMFSSIADGTSHVTGFLQGADAMATLNSFRAMGVEIEGPVNGELTVHGVGVDGLKQPQIDIDLGNSGTSIRLLSGLLAGQSFPVAMVGDASLSRRPMGRVADPLRLMNADIETAEAGRPPLKLKGGAQLKAIDYPTPMASAQVKSCVLLAGLYADGVTRVKEPAITRDHTERMLSAFGVEIGKDDQGWISIEGGQRLSACDIDVPADISSAAFFMVAASIVPGSELLLQHVGINPTRTGIIDILQLMGGDITLENQREIGGEPVADIRVKAAQLKGIHIPEHLVPLAIDEFPVLFVAAACAEGETILTGAEELRVKESDRIQVMADGLQILGVDAQPTADGMVVRGAGLSGTVSGGAFGGGRVMSDHDHRIAMSFSVAGLRSTAPIEIDGCEIVATSFPNFVELACKAGFGLQAVEENE
ncbi:3-phosphoshikimate 1-carboxyvinyltransferase [Pelagibaculum spongiae]|uniref:3-phosphoshikimate 1-carboxyvinyltransferase n=1 Tax=Pelagibaculum spongiae TaxID=2080658 RepID=A0A2V1GZL1_9GAMM|nr:3-phosphoshikimate 1-carboxyvinyltransferase [Pelagibaculum spongiae]